MSLKCSLVDLFLREGRENDRYRYSLNGHEWAKARHSPDRPEATACSTAEGKRVHRQVQSEGHAEKYRAVIDVKPKMNRSAQRVREIEDRLATDLS
jgi:hypothetical protein